MAKNLRHYIDLWDRYIRSRANPVIELDTMADFVDFMQAGLDGLEQRERDGKNPFNRKTLTPEQKQAVVDFGLFYTNFQSFEEWRKFHTKMRELIASLEAEVAKLKADNARLQAELDAANQARAADQERIKILEQRIRELEERLRELESGASAKAARDAELARFRERWQRLQDEIARVQTEHADARKRQLDLLKQRAEAQAEGTCDPTAREALGQLQTARRVERDAVWSEADGEIAALAGQIDEFDSELEGLAAAIAQSRAHAQARSTELDTLRTSEPALNEEAAKAKTALAQAAAELNAVLDEQQALEKERADSLAVLDDPENIDPAQAEALRGKLVEFETRATALADRELTARDALPARTEVAAMHARAQRVAQARLTALQQDREADERRARELEALRTRVQTRRDAVRRSLDRMHDLRAASAAATPAAPGEAAPSRVAAVEADLASATDDVDRLRSQLDGLVTRRAQMEDETFGDCADVLTVYRNDVKDADRRAQTANTEAVTAIGNHANAAAKAAHRLALLEAHRQPDAGVRDRIDFAIARADQRDADAGALSEIVVALLAQLDEGWRREASLRDEIADLRRQLAELDANSTSSDAARQAAEKRASVLAQRLAALSLDYAKLLARLMDLTAKIAGLNARIAQLQARIDELLKHEAENLELRKRISFLESQARKYEGVLKGDVVQGGEADEKALRGAVVDNVDVNQAAQRLTSEYGFPAQYPMPEKVNALVRASEVVGRLKFKLGAPEARMELLEEVRALESRLKTTYTRYSSLRDRPDHKPLLADELRDLLDTNACLAAWTEAFDLLLNVIKLAQDAN